MVDYRWQTSTIVLEILGESIRHFNLKSSTYVNDKFTPVAMLDSNTLLAFTIKDQQDAIFFCVHLGDDLHTDLDDTAFQKCGVWSVESFYRRLAFTMLRVVAQVMFGTVLCHQRPWAIVMGPPENYLSRDLVESGCKLFDTKTMKFVKVRTQDCAVFIHQQ